MKCSEAIATTEHVLRVRVVTRVTRVAIRRAARGSQNCGGWRWLVNLGVDEMLLFNELAWLRRSLVACARWVARWMVGALGREATGGSGAAGMVVFATANCVAETVDFVADQRVHRKFDVVCEVRVVVHQDVEARGGVAIRVAPC